MIIRKKTKNNSEARSFPRYDEIYSNTNALVIPAEDVNRTIVMTVIGGDDGEGNDDPNNNNNNNNNGVIHTLPVGVDIQIRFLLYHILTIILRDITRIVRGQEGLLMNRSEIIYNFLSRLLEYSRDFRLHFPEHGEIADLLAHVVQVYILLYIVRLNLGNIRDLSSFLTITDIQEAGDFYTWEYLRDNLERVLRQIEPNFEDDINDDEDADPFEDLSRWL